jgi:hypothetical protein
MTFSDWFDNNWVDLARLLIQCGILAAVIWYSRNILKTLRASQEQIGALLRLSVSEGAADEHESSLAEPALTPPGFTSPVGVPRIGGNPATTPASAFGSLASLTSHVPGRDQSLGGHIALEKAAVREPEPVRTESPSLTPWVAAPAIHSAEPTEGFAARIADSRRNLGHWLNEPPRRRTGGTNPFRRMIRWLQAPAGH